MNVCHTIDHLLGYLAFRCLGVLYHFSTRFNIDATNWDVATPRLFAVAADEILITCEWAFVALFVCVRWSWYADL